jgi:hypothetical protein
MGAKGATAEVFLTAFEAGKIIGTVLFIQETAATNGHTEIDN